MTSPAATPSLCPLHEQQASEWRGNHYNPRNPSEWPGGMNATGATLLMDSRTSHEERAREFDRRNAEQVALITRICTSGTSPQCTPTREETAPCPPSTACAS